MIERDGQFTWPEDQVYGGIRQDASESVSRYRYLQNVNLSVYNSIVKDKGVRRLTDSSLYSGGEIYTLFDTRFHGGVQKLVAFANNGTNGKCNVFNTDRSWSEQTPTFAQVRPSVNMFGNRMVILDGSTLRSWTGSAWATPGNSTVNPCTFAVVYKNRLICFGDPSNPYYFYPSDIRTRMNWDGTDWDANYAVEVTDSRGEEIKGAMVVGSFLIVGGRTFTHAHVAGSKSRYDWDWDELSSHVGPINFESCLSISRAYGNDLQNYGFFWSEEGPMMVVQQGQGLPSVLPLWESIRYAVRGETYQGMTGLNTALFSKIETVWDVESREVRFACASSASSENDMLLCLDLDSAIRFALGAGDDPQAYPYWRVRNNSTWNFPAQAVGTVQVDDSTGLPSTTGRNKTLIGRDGYLYEMDSDTSCYDMGVYPIRLVVTRDGYDGFADRIREHTKSLRQVRVRTTQEGNYKLYVRMRADGGRVSTPAEIDLSSGLLLWGDGRSWGDGTRWNSGEFVTERGGVGLLGQKFDMDMYDDGNIRAPVQINSWAFMGYTEDRR